MFVRGINEKGQEVYFFVEKKNGTIMVCEVSLFALASDVKITTLRPIVGNDLPKDDRDKKIEELSPRIVIKNGDNEIIVDLTNGEVYCPTPLLQVKFI